MQTKDQRGVIDEPKGFLLKVIQKGKCGRRIYAPYMTAIFKCLADLRFLYRFSGRKKASGVEYGINFVYSTRGGC